MSQNRYYSSSAAQATLAAGITNATTTFSVSIATGWPASVPFTLILERDTGNEEVVNVTSITGTSVTVTRGQDGTTAVAHNAGAVVEHGVSARDYNEPQVHIAATSGVHGATGSVVGTTDTQTLTNKTLTTPTIGSFANAGHTHANAAGGGTLAQANTHGTPDTDSATTSLHHTIGASATQAAAGNHTHLQATSHGSPDTDAATTSLHHTLGAGANQAASGNHTHAAVTHAALDSSSTLGGVSGTALAADRAGWTSFTPSSFYNAAVGGGGAVFTGNFYYRLVGMTLFLRFHITSGAAAITDTVGLGLPPGMTAAATGSQVAASNSTITGPFVVTGGGTVLMSKNNVTATSSVAGVVLCGVIEVQ